MSETLLWLLYVAGAAAACAAVYRLGWKIVPSTLAATAITVVGWAALYFLADEEKRPSFWEVDLSLNACFALIFAGAGAALGLFLASRERAG